MAQQVTEIRGRTIDVPAPGSGERRRSKRRPSQQLVLTFLGIDHVALNWSAGGVLVAEHHYPPLAIGTSVSGIATIRGIEGRFRFAGELVRRDVRVKELAFRFINPSRALLDAIAKISE
jgi:hypothetical protein